MLLELDSSQGILKRRRPFSCAEILAEIQYAQTQQYWEKSPHILYYRYLLDIHNMQ